MTSSRQDFSGARAYPWGMAPPTRAPKPFIGVPTTTPVAFLHSGKVHLERMAVLGEDGAGILAPVALPVGETLEVVFRLSSSSVSVRAAAVVEGDVPTTPAGLQLRAKLGDQALKAALGGTPGDSATMMFKLSDLDVVQKQSKAQAYAGKATGFCIRFTGLDDAGKAAVAHHIKTSRALGDQMGAQGGSAVALAEDDRKTLAVSAFDSGDISKRAMDW